MKTISNTQDAKNKSIEAIRAKRTELKKMSQPLKELLKAGVIESINDGLRGIYANDGHTNLKTLKQWNKEGFLIKKGEHAFLLWGTPVNRTGKQPDTEQDEETEFFPVCFVFSQNQVQPKNN